MSQTTTINFAPNRYVMGLNVTWLNNVVATISPGQCRDANNLFDMYVNEPLTLGVLNNGIGGLDVGALLPNNSYSIYIVSDPQNTIPPYAIASLTSNPLPLMPYNYQIYRRIGYFTTSTTPVVNTYLTSGQNNDKVINLDVEVSISLTANSPSYTTVALATNFPQVPGLTAYLSIAPFIDGSTPANYVVGVRGTGVVLSGPNTACYLTMHASNNSSDGIGYQTAPTPVITGGTTFPSIDYSGNYASQLRIAGWIDSL
jgi:hypothetical protein